MKLKNAIVSLLVLGSLIINDVVAQDTTVIKTFTFQDISKRRGVYVFPDGTQSYRKILMKYTLKCDPQTRRDQYDCGEWDYDSYNYIYGHDGILDSTRKSKKLYLENGVATDSLHYNARPFYDYWQETQYTIRHANTTSLTKDSVGAGVVATKLTFNSENKVGKSQYIWRASELLSAGLSSGNITGIELDISTLGSEMRNFEVKIGHTNLDSLTGGMFLDTGMTSVYRHNKTFSNTGFQDLQFLAPFNWNGSDNVVIEFSFEGESKGTNTELKSDSLQFDAGLAVAGSSSYLNFNGSPQWLNLKKDPTITGAKPRTIEMWAKIDRFNNAGLFRAGTGGSRKDFSLRTTTKDDQFRIQLWGGDLNFNYPGAKGNWHHYAMVYDGVKTMVYIDGVLIATKVFTLNTPFVDFQVGRWQGAFLFGQLDEIRVWDKALSASIIKSWMGKSVDNTHPDFGNLHGYYPLDENEGKAVKDVSAKGNVDGVMSGLPTWKTFTAQNLFLNKTITTHRPNIVFEKGVYTSVIDSTTSTDSVGRNPVNLVIYGNAANGVQIPENDPNHPSKVTRNTLVWKANDFSNTYDKVTGKRLSWKFIKADSTINQTTKIWYSPEYRLEIGRFITPYGKGLNLGPNGFTWWYDVTDYVQYLSDSVDLQAGNQQELIDLQFLFIKGTPAREVVQLNRVWGQNRGYSYKSLDNDDNLKATTIDLHKKSKSYRVKTRFSGHGHHSSTGGYPHCCEWKDNTHSLIVNGTKFSDWHIWQKTECAENAVFPQGGTWPGAREGWCPGDIVEVNEFEISDMVSGNKVTLDYSITPVPAGNPGMGNGDYRIAVHLLQYGKANFANDAEIYDVINPNKSGIKSRKGVLCENPKIVLRNGGSNELKNCEIRYRVGEGDIRVINWSGGLAFMDMVEVEIPVTDEGFYSGNGDNLFNIRVCNPNGVRDENPENDEINVSYGIPEVYPAKIVVRLITNNNPGDNSYQIKDMAGNVVLEKKSSELSARSTYSDTLNVGEGCYTMYFHDSGHDGLSYWANSSQGNGVLQYMILDSKGNLTGVKTFKRDFGRSLRHAFSINKKLGEFALKSPSGNKWNCSNIVGTEEYSFESNISLFPNPSNGNVSVELFNLKGNYDLTVYSSMGRVVYQGEVKSDGYFYKELNLVGQASGIYILQLKGAEGVQTRRFVIEGN